MIILKQLRWSNCFSYAENNVVNLTDSSLTQILGVNGAGKSSIPLLLEEVLFNKNSKGVKKADIPNRSSNGIYSISLDFFVDNDAYTIDLVRAKALKIKLIKNEEDISSHTATNTFNTIEDIIGIDFKTFSQLVYQSPTSSLQFLTATDATRKKFLIDLLNLSKYVDYFDLFKEKLKEYNDKVISVASKIETLDSWLLENNLSNMTVLPKVNLDIFVEKDEEELATLRLELENIFQNNKKITNNNHYREQLAKFDVSRISSIKANKIQSYDDLTTKASACYTEAKAAKALCAKMNALGDKCPTCNQTVDNTFKMGLVDEQSNISFFKGSEAFELEEEIKKIKANNKEFREKQTLERDFQTLFRSVDDSLPGTIKDAGSLEKEIDFLSNVVKRNKVKISEIIAENLKIERNNTKIQVITEQRDDFLAQVKELKEDFKEIQQIHTNLEILKKAFSTNGLLAYKIENLVKELEDIVNEYLAELSEGRFTLEFEVVKDRLNVNITDEGSLVDILSLSSGELSRVNTATLLAIRKLMNSISKSQINVLFLDEVINTLDEPGKDTLVEILLKETKLNVFIVSHGWEHPLLNKLEVYKDKGISRIDNG